jgi:hypothetical protein
MMKTNRAGRKSAYAKRPVRVGRSFEGYEAARYIFPMTAVPNSEHLSSFAPGIMRARS